MILEKIVATTKQRVEEEKNQIPITLYQEEAEKIVHKNGTLQTFERALKQEGIHFICEVKKASPSKGVLVENFEPVEIAKEYEAAGASAISVLTEPSYFLGSDRYLKEIHKTVEIPLLRKDFIIDPYQIYQAKVIGASAVLLICRILSPKELQEMIALCETLGLSALVEIHGENEAEIAIQAGAKIVGVNNRNLSDFTVDIQNSLRLRKYIPKEIVFVAESGIKSAEDIRELKDANVNAVLIGETMIKSTDKAGMIKELKRLI